MSWIVPKKTSASIKSRKKASDNSARKVRPKKEWNLYLTDENKYSVSREELLKRKALFISKHNVLSDGYTPPPVTIRSKKSIIGHREPHYDEQKREVTSLDLLALSSDEDDNDDDENTIHRNDDHQRYGQPISQEACPDFARKTSTITEVVSQKPPHIMETPKKVAFISNKKSSKSPKQKIVASSKFSPQKTTQPSPTEQMKDTDLKEISDEVCMLLKELRSYEEMTGKASSLEIQVHKLPSPLFPRIIITITAPVWFYRSWKVSVHQMILMIYPRRKYLNSLSNWSVVTHHALLSSLLLSPSR
jgi:hypothetical protein